MRGQRSKLPQTENEGLVYEFTAGSFTKQGTHRKGVGNKQRKMDVRSATGTGRKVSGLRGLSAEEKGPFMALWFSDQTQWPWPACDSSMVWSHSQHLDDK